MKDTFKIEKKVSCTKWKSWKGLMDTLSESKFLPSPFNKTWRKSSKSANQPSSLYWTHLFHFCCFIATSDGKSFCYLYVRGIPLHLMGSLRKIQAFFLTLLPITFAMNFVIMGSLSSSLHENNLLNIGSKCNSNLLVHYYIFTVERRISIATWKWYFLRRIIVL